MLGYTIYSMQRTKGSRKEFTDWIKGRIDKYEFIEVEDWKLTFAKTGKRKKVNDYSLTLDMAKELSMAEN